MRILFGRGLKDAADHVDGKGSCVAGLVTPYNPKCYAIPNLPASRHTEVEHEGRSSDLLDGEECLGLHGSNLLGRLLRGRNYFWGIVSNCERGGFRRLHHIAAISRK